MLTPIARGLALFLGGFTLLNLAGDLRFRGTGGNIWWIDFPLLPARVSQVLLALIAALLITYAFVPRVGRGRLVFACILLGAAILAALVNAVTFYLLLGQRRITSSFPLPLSIIIAASLVVILIAHAQQPGDHRFVFAAAFVLAGIAFPLAQISLFGLTDYRRPADLVVVFGARAYADGSASDALADRVRTACALYRAGLAPKLLLSGGPGDGSVDEPEAMRRLARTLGVPDEALELDPHGVNTEATVRNTMSLLAARPQRILAVSHFYHLPRIKMTYQRYGAEVLTVPCDTSVRSVMPANLVREDLAFWAYYLRRLG
jgi:uncharacterized SAM-binding protein YcdF (DUF218 family)